MGRHEVSIFIGMVNHDPSPSGELVPLSDRKFRDGGCVLFVYPA